MVEAQQRLSTGASKITKNIEVPRRSFKVHVQVMFSRHHFVSNSSFTLQECVNSWSFLR